MSIVSVGLVRTLLAMRPLFSLAVRSWLWYQLDVVFLILDSLDAATRRRAAGRTHPQGRPAPLANPRRARDDAAGGGQGGRHHDPHRLQAVPQQASHDGGARHPGPLT